MKNISRFLNIKKKEYSRIIFLIVQSLFYGVFISYYNSYSMSVLDKNLITYAYLGSGIVGVVLASIFSYSLNRMSFKTHSIVTLGFISAFILVLKIVIDLDPSNKNIGLIGFIFYAPLISFTTMVFSSLTMKLFDLRQGKRLFSLIASGSVIAAVISYLTVPLILSFFNNSSVLLWCALGGVVLGGIIQIIINKKFSEYIVGSEAKVISNNRRKKIKIFGDSYFKSIWILSLFSMAGLILVSYLFLNASKVYFEDPVTLGVFIGLFLGVTKVIELLMNTFVSGKLLEKFGLKFGLSVLPFALLILSILALIFSLVSLTFGGYSDIIYIIIVLNMLALIIVKRSLEDSSFKLLFQPISTSIRSIVQSNTEGKARQLGAIVIGLILVVIQFIIPSNYIQIACVTLLVPLCFAWIKKINEVFIQYKNYISKKLDNIQINTVNVFQVNSFVNTLEPNSDYSKNLMLKLLLPGVNYLYGKDTSLHTDFKNLQLTSVSQRKIDRIDAMHKNWVQRHFNEIIHLLEDNDHYVVEYLLFTLKAKIMSKSFKNFIESKKNDLSIRLTLLLYLIDYDSLILKKEIEIALSTNTVIGNALNLILLDVILSDNFESCTDLMLNGLHVKDIEIESRIVSALLNHEVRNTDPQYLLIKNKIEDEVSNYNWLLAALLDLDYEPQLEDMVDLLKEKLEKSTYRIFKLTTLIYDKNEVSKIRDITQDGILENKILAIELVDILFDEEFKEYLMPVIDDLEYNEKYYKLNNHFPVARLNPIDRLKSILNLEHERLNTWIRLKAMKLLIHQNLDGNIPSEITAHIFNKDLLLREGAFYCLSKISKDTFSFYFEKDASKIHKLYTKTYDYVEGFLNVYELHNYLKNSLFLTNATESDIIKILRITNHKIYSKDDLESIEIGYSAFLMLDGNDQINDFQNLELDIHQNDDLLIFKGRSLLKFKDFCDDDIKMLKIDAISLINIIASSESLEMKF